MTSRSLYYKIQICRYMWMCVFFFLGFLIILELLVILKLNFITWHRFSLGIICYNLVCLKSFSMAPVYLQMANF